DAATLRVVARHRVTAGVDYDWVADTLVGAQLDYVTPWRIRSDPYRWVPNGTWRRPTRGAPLVPPAGGGGRLGAVALAAGRPRPRTGEPLGARAPAPLPDGTLVYVTLGAHGWELRHAAPLAGGAAAPVTFPEPLPFDAAPAVPVRETGYTSWPSLRPHFWIPVYADAGPTGRFYGAFTAGTDAVGRFVYGADVYVSGRPFRAAGDFALVSTALGNPTLD